MTKFMQPVSQEILVGIPLSGRECQLVPPGGAAVTITKS